MIDKLLLILKGAPIGNQNAAGPHRLRVVRHEPNTVLETVELSAGKKAVKITPNHVTFGLLDETGAHYKDSKGEYVFFPRKKTAEQEAAYHNAKFAATS